MANITKDQWNSLFADGANQPVAGNPDDIRRQQWVSVMGAPIETESMPWSSVGAQAFTNIPQSAKKYATDVYEAVTSPVETMQGLGALTKAAINAITPDVIAKWLYDPKEAEKAGQVGTAVADFYRQRYGTVENFKQSVAQDPVGVMGDLSTVLNIGGGAAKMATMVPQIGEQGKVAALAKRLSGASQITDPLMLTGKTAGVIASKVTGALTGVGQETVKGAARAGFEGDQNFVQSMRGQVPADQAVINARHNLSVMRQNRNAQYRSGMVDIKNDKKLLSFNDIDKALRDALSDTSYYGEIVSEEAAKKLADAQKVVNRWKSNDPTKFHTPEGMDKLKQKIGDILQGTPYEQTDARRVLGNLYNSVKSTISSQAPTYANVMKDYSDASEALREVEMALKLGPRASTDTALRRLQSVTRDNANTNYGNRMTLAQQLEAEGGKPFISMLQGQAMKGKTARGLAGVGENLSILGGAVVDPKFLATIPFQTPRLVGEAAYYGGRAAKGVSAPFRAIGADAQDLNTLATMVRPQSDSVVNQTLNPISLSDIYQQMITR